MVNDVTQQQIVEMTPVARHVDDFVITCNVVQAIDVTQFNSVVNTIPYPAEKTFHNPDGRIGNVRRDFLGVFAGLVCCPFQFGAAVTRFGFDGSAHAGIVQHNIDKRPAVREIRPDGDRKSVG